MTRSSLGLQIWVKKCNTSWDTKHGKLLPRFDQPAQKCIHVLNYSTIKFKAQNGKEGAFLLAPNINWWFLAGRSSSLTVIKAARSPMFTNVEATPLSGKRFVGKRQGISHQITRQTASLLQGCEAVISAAERKDPEKVWGWCWGTPNSSQGKHESVFHRNCFCINLSLVLFLR